VSQAPISAGLLDSPPLFHSRRAAAASNCDLAIGNRIGIGSLICLTPVVKLLARRLGRPLRLLTAPYDTWNNRPLDGTPYPMWEHNPYISEIVDGCEFNANLMWEVSRESHNFPQIGHFIDNHLAAHGLRRPPNMSLHGDLYLTTAERCAAMERLAHLPRPLVCLCPYGRSSSGPDSPWYLERWLELIAALEGAVGLFTVGGIDNPKPLPVEQPVTSIREFFALLWAADAYVGFDTGPAHAAAAFGVPSLVLWDAVTKSPQEESKQPGYATATLNRWAYPQNRNLTILGEYEGEILQEIISFLAAQLFTPCLPEYKEKADVINKFCCITGDRYRSQSTTTERSGQQF
jgi:hypothetical protein